MHPTLFFPFIHTYGLMLAIGFYVAWYVGARRARSFGEDPDVFGNVVLSAIIAGVAGARLLYFILYKDPKDPIWAIFSVWQGGLIFYGGLIGAALACLVYLRWRRANIGRIADAMAPSLALGQAFGRIGCFLNGCCYGGPASASWALGVRFPRFMSVAQPGSPPKPTGSPAFLDHVHRHWLPDTAPTALPVHPTQLYASVSLFLIAAIVIAATPYRRRDGELFGLVLILNGAHRFAIELVRRDTPQVALGLRWGQIFAVAVLALGFATFLWARTRRGANAPAPPQSP